MALTGKRTFVGFGFGAIQAGLFLYEAYQSDNFGRLVVAEVLPDRVDAVRRVDLLVTEATYLERDADMARRFGHLTALQAATLAKEADVRKLVLTHISRRYRDRDVLEEAQTVFAETVVAHDFDRFQVVRQQT